MVHIIYNLSYSVGLFIQIHFVAKLRNPEIIISTCTYGKAKSDPFLNYFE